MYGMSVITALTAQNTTGVYGRTSPDFVANQIDCIFNDISRCSENRNGINREIIKIIAEKLIQYKAKNIVVDPVMVATSGSKLISDEAISTLIKELIPLATVITPNIPEAEVLCGFKIKDEKDMVQAAKKISEQLKGAVLVKGGHLVNDAIDLLMKMEISIGLNQKE